MAKDSSSEALAISQHDKGASVDQTRLGLVFLILGVLVSAVPYIAPIGIAIVFVAAILLVLGRGPFGGKHSNSAIAATAILLLGAGFVLVGSTWYLLYVLSIPSASCLPPDWLCDNALTGALVPHLSSILAIEAAGAILTSLAFALFTYFLQRPIWRIVLLVAFATSFATSLLVFSILNSDITSPLVSGSPSLLQAYRNGWDWEVARAFADRVFTVRFLNVIPAAIFAAAYYAVYSRLGRGHLT